MGSVRRGGGQGGDGGKGGNESGKCVREVMEKNVKKEEERGRGGREVGGMQEKSYAEECERGGR